MAGRPPFSDDPSLGEQVHVDYARLDTISALIDSIAVASNVNPVSTSSTRPSLAFITPPPYFPGLELRQDIPPPPPTPSNSVAAAAAPGDLAGLNKAGAPPNSQDIQNQIIAAVDRATVEISRTIIALNATFSQQIDSAQKSASAGIKSAQDQANTTITLVLSTASSISSSAFSVVGVARLAVNTANVQLSSISAALSADESSLSSASLALAAASTSAAQALSSLSSSSSSDVAKLSLSSSSDIAGLSQSIDLLKSSLAFEQVRFWR